MRGIIFFILNLIFYQVGDIHAQTCCSGGVPLTGNLGMPEQQTIEQRLTEVERELAELKRRLPLQTGGKSWVERIAGTFKDDPDFDEIVRRGREFRQSVP